MKLIRNFFAAVGCLTLLFVGALGAWWYWDDLQAWWSSRAGIEATEPSPELAERAEERMNAFLAGRGPDEVRLSEMEVQSYVRYRLASALPAGVTDPRVELRDSTLAMSVALHLTKLAETSPAAENLRRFFGDSARVNTELYPVVTEPGIGHVTVLGLQAGLVPVPPFLLPNVLAQTGYEVTGGRTLVVPVPREVSELRISGDAVVLTRRR